MAEPEWKVGDRQNITREEWVIRKPVVLRAATSPQPSQREPQVLSCRVARVPVRTNPQNTGK